MGATYTRQSSYTDGDVITAAHTNSEFDQLLAVFQASSGHTHDGTANEGGPITKMLGTALTLGDGTAGTDIAVTFDGESNDGVLTWMEDEDYFQFSDDILISSTEKLYFNDTGTHIFSNADGDLDLVADGTNDDAIKLASAGGVTVDAAGDIILDAGGADVLLKDDGTQYASFTNSSGDLIVKSGSTTAMTFSGANVTFAGTVTIGSAGISETELEILDGATITTAELNLMDGGTSAGTTAVAGGDGIVTNDGGTMRQTTVDTFDTYLAQTTKTLTNKTLTTPVIAEIDNSGDITLDSGADIILDADGGDVFFKDAGTTFGSATNTSGNLIIKSGTTTALTFSGADVTIAGDLTISGDDLTMGTNTADMLLIADGTNFNPTAISSLSSISTVANDDVFLAIDTSGGGLKQVTRSTIVSGLAVGGVALSNIVEDTTPQLGGDLDVNGQDIVSTSNGNITITPNGSGVVRLDGNVDIQSGLIDLKNSGAVSKIKFYCESSNAHAQILQGAPHSESASNTLTLPSSGGDVNLVSTASTATLTNKTFGDNVSFGDNNITNVGDIALDSISADATDINVAVTDNSATAFTVKQGSDAYLVIDTGNSSESVAIGTGVSGTAITLGHSTSEVTVADNLTVTGDLLVSGTTTTVNSTTVNLNDHNIVLDSGNSTSAVINGAGITIEGGTGSDATFTYNTSGPQFELKLASDYEDLQIAKLTATELDISGDADIDGTLEADAITVNGTALNTVIAGVTVTDATNSAHVLVTDNESTDEDNLITFVENATSSTGNVGLEMDGNLTYNPSTGRLTATQLAGTLQTAAQANVTSLGTLTTLTVDNVIINGSTIGHTGDTDLITVASGVMTVAGEVDATSLDISGDADIDGTLEADAITVNGATLSSVIADEATALAIALG